MMENQASKKHLTMERIPLPYFSELSEEEATRIISLARSERDSYKEAESQKKAKKASGKTKKSSTPRKSSSDKAAAMLKSMSPEQIEKLKAQGIL